MESECFERSFKKQGISFKEKEKKNQRCLKYFRTLVDKGKDVEEIFKLQKLKRDENKQNGELSKRLDLLEEKTESELQRTHAYTTTHFNFQLYTLVHSARTCAFCPKFKCTHNRMFLILIFLKDFSSVAFCQ